MFVGFIAMIYGVWLTYAAGANYLFMCALLYAPGIALYWWARRAQGKKAFTSLEAAIGLGIVIAAIAAGYLMWTGSLHAL